MKRPRSRFRLLIASLTFHALALSFLLLINDYQGGKGGAASGDTFSVTWEPGDGKGAGKKGLDTAIPDQESGNSLEAHGPMESKPAPEMPKLLSVSQTDPQAVFNADTTETLTVESATAPEIRKLAMKSTIPDAVANEKLVASATTAVLKSATDPDSSDDELEMNSAGSKGRGAGEAGAGAGTGIGGESGEGIAVFFGIIARGRRVVYVIDASESMSQHNAMTIARRELWASLKDLAPSSQFQIVFFNLTNHTMNRPGERPQLLPATSNNLRLAKQFLKGIQPDSGTDRFKAISHALSLNPDIVYLLTDVDAPELSAQELFDLHRSNKRKAKIHVIEFGIDADLGGDSFLKKLARQNGGTHLYRDLTRAE